MKQNLIASSILFLAATGVGPALFADSGLISTVAGGGLGTVGGPATSMALANPESLAIDAFGNLFIAEIAKFRILRVDAASGLTTVLAGTGQSGYSGDGGPGQMATIAYPGAIAVDTAGNVFFSDISNNRVRRIDAQSGIITTFAGTGTAASSGDGGLASAASFNRPTGLAFDNAGNLFVADTSGCYIRRIDSSSGIITTVAGTGAPGPSTDGGTALSTTLQPLTVVVDLSGNLYFSDLSTHRVRRVDAVTRIVSTVVGNSNYSFSGDGGLGVNTAIGSPAGLGLDSGGNVYVAAPNANRIFKIDFISHLVTTVAGTGIAASSGDGGQATSASLNFPEFLAVAPNGNLIVSEFLGNRVRRVFLPSSNPYTTTVMSSSISGQSATLTATVTPIGTSGIPTGSIQFSDLFTSNVVGSAQLVNGTASLATTSLNGGGIRDLVASYSGDGAFNSSTSVYISVQVPPPAKVPTTVALTSASNPTVPNMTVNYVGTVSPATDGSGHSPSGSMDLWDGNTFITTVSVVNGIAQFSVSLPGLGSHPLSTFYYGDSFFANSYSPVLSETVKTPVLTLTSDNNPSLPGGTVDFTASHAQTTATGTMSFTDQASSSGSPVVLATVPMVNATATYSTSSLTAGAHYIVANYSGDANFPSGSSSYLVEVVSRTVGTIVTILSQQNATPNQTVTVVAQVAPATSSANVPSGTLQLLDGTSVLASATLANGSTQFSISFPVTGTHALTAVYSGDGNFSASTSSVLNEYVRTTARIVLVSDINPVTAGSTVTFTVSFYDSGVTGSVQLVDYPNPGGNSIVLSSAELTNSKAVFPISTLLAGTHNISAFYNGDSNFLSSSSQSLAEVVRDVTTITVSAPSNSSVFGQSVTFTAQVSRPGATGMVTFLDGPTYLGAGTLSNGTASLAVTTLTTGTHSITAIYNGDPNNAGSTSSVLTETINKIAPTVSLTSSANPSTYGQSITLTATVGPTAATGTVQFLDGTTSLGTGTLSNGTASLPVTALTTGTHSITAVYSGDPNNVGGTSSVLTETINKIAPTVSLAPSANPSTFGQSITLTATVAPTAATGTVQFLDGTTSLGTGTLSNGSASLAVTTLTTGTHSITAVYSGDVNNAGSTSSVLTETINKIAPTVSLTSSANPSTYGQSITLTATVGPTAATGTVQFLDGTTSLGTGTLSNGTASLPVTALTTGTHSITAVYSGDPNNVGGTSSVLTETINKIAPTVSLAPSANPSTFGQSITLTATVAPTAATGTVQFLDGTTSLGTGTLSNGSASLAVTTLTTGTHSITAVYSGDVNNAGSTSSVLTQTINKIASTVGLTSSANPSTFGQSITLTATVGPATAAGTVQFLDGTISLGTGTLSNGTASLAVTTLTAGTHSITAVYSGDVNNAGSTSSVLAQIINKIASTVGLTSSANPSTFGQSITLTATVAPTAASGTVQFLDGTISLGTGTLSNGTASLAVTTLTAGTHSITAVYSGDVNNAGSTSSVLTQIINKIASTVGLTSSANPLTFGQSVTLTATVAPTAASGTVQFFDGTASLGTSTLSNGTASLPVTTLTAGTHSITAVYSGDVNNAGSTSSVLAQIINKIASTVGLTSSANPSTFGQSITLTATVAPTAASGTVQFLDGTISLGTGTLSNGTASLPVTTLTTGTHSITAAYSGDVNNAGSTSSVLAQTINKIASTVSLTSSANPSTFGQSITLTATVAPTAASGTVQFLDGTNALGTGTLSNGTASLTIATATAGTHSITAVYSGDAGNAASTSTVLTQTINKAAATTSLTSSANPSTFGQSITLTATVAPAAATGTVQFMDGSTSLGTATLSAGSASFNASALIAGSHSLTAVYSGGSNYTISSSTALAQVVNAGTSTTTLQATATTLVYGQAVQLTAILAPATATGTIQFLDGGAALGAASLSGGTGAITVTTLAAGTHNVTAVYSGDANNAASTSAVVTITVAQANSAVTLVSSLNPAVAGQSVTFTATVAPAAAAGSVQFMDGATSLGSITLTAGSASINVSTLSAGSHAITATYSGNANYKASSSGALSQTVSTPPPGPPANLAATGSSSSQINLSWTASATSGVTYNIYSSTTSGFTPSASNKIASGITATTYSNTGLTASTTYYYVVKAQNGGGESAASNQASVATQAGSSVSCHVAYTITTQWNVGFGTAITIQNTGTTPINGWKLSWTWAGNQQITQSWNSNYTQTGTAAALTNASWNGTVAPGATLNGMGFNGSYSGANTSPTAFYVNGTACH